MIFDKYPYTNFHEMNDDWVIQTLREFEKRLDEFVVMNSLTYADPIGYDPQTPYQANTVVIYNDTAYVSKAASTGILPTNADYWLLIFPFGDLINEAVNAGVAAGVADLTAQIDEYLTAAGNQITAAIAAIPADVASWLAAHPEVTTTVQNASIGFPKLTGELQNVLLADYYSDHEVSGIAQGDFTQGTINTTNGANASAANVCRTDYVTFETGIVIIRAAIDYIVKVYKYTQANVFVNVTHWSVTDQWDAFVAESGYKYRFTIMKDDETDFTPSDLPASAVWYNQYVSKCAEQINNISNKLAELKKQENTITGIEPLSFNYGAYIQTVAPGTAVNLTPINDNTMCYAIFECVAGQDFYITGKPYNNSAKRPCMFVDDQGICLERNAWLIDLDNQKITAPTGAVKIVVNLVGGFNEFVSLNGPVDMNSRINDINSAVNARVDYVEKNTYATPYNYTLDDLFNNLESDFIDDFTQRNNFIDSDHEYVKIGSGATDPTITTGVGATRTGSGQSSNVQWYSRNITRFPFYVLIGSVIHNGSRAHQAIKLYDNTPSTTVPYIWTDHNGTVKYGSNTIGTLHKNSLYTLLCIDQGGVTLFDDCGCNVRISQQYDPAQPKNIMIGFLFANGREYGYGSYVEFVREQMQILEYDKIVKYAGEGEPSSTINAYTTFGHTVYWNNGASSIFYKTPDANPYMAVVPSGIGNNMCIKCLLTGEDEGGGKIGYRTESFIRTIKDAFANQIGGLQRFKFSLDYFIDSIKNIDDGSYYTYIFQLHNSNFSAQGWTDAPPLAIRFVSGKLYAIVNYIDDGSVPGSDANDPNKHTTDEYELCNFTMDTWHHIDVEARIAWKTTLAPRLIIKVDGVERLNIETAIGFNIVSSNGRVDIHYGLYCPQWRTNPNINNKYREILVTNIKWRGTICF